MRRCFTLALTCCLVFIGCATKVQQSLYLEEKDLVAAADALYGKLCQSGKLDEIAATYEGCKPKVWAASVTTTNLNSRNSSLEVDVFSERIVDKLVAGNHMRWTAETRSAAKTGILVRNEKISEGGKDLQDFDLQCEIRGIESTVGDERVEVDYTFSAALFDLHDDSSLFWKAEYRITRVFEL